MMQNTGKAAPVGDRLFLAASGGQPVELPVLYLLYFILNVINCS